MPGTLALNDLHRIIDANTNRASEGIRVLEDLARFSLNNEPQSRKLKDLRHRLRSSIESLGLSQTTLLESRNTANDLGTQISTANESNRALGLPDLVAAASKRTQEALRVLEETVKVLGYSGSEFESIRYAMYDIQRDMALAFTKPSPNWTVCVLLTKSLCLHHAPERVIEMAFKAGAQCIQIREKDMPSDELFEHASQMIAVAHDLGLVVIFNDRVDLALATGADGVHLGQHDLPISVARSILGPSKLIGRSCSSMDQLHEAFGLGADYCGLGPVFASTTKSKPNLYGIDTLKQVMADSELRTKPMLAISGITPGNIEQVWGTGFAGVAISSAVCSAADPYASCKAIVESRQSLVELP